jgi:deazaflavin-dependent oxidoreductase (nitroreductase family)
VSRGSAPALRGTWLGSLLRVWNPVMRRLLESPAHWPWSRWFAVLAWSGRKTGRRYTTPVSYVTDGDASYVTTGDRWWRNLIGGAEVAVRIGGRWHQGHATAITDPERSRIEHERLFREHPWFRVLAGIPRGKGGGPDRHAVEQSVVAGRVLVRIEGLKRRSGRGSGAL